MGAEASKDLFVDLTDDGEKIPGDLDEKPWLTCKDAEGHLMVFANTPLGRTLQERDKVVPGKEVPREIYTGAGHLSDVPGEARPQVIAAVYARLGALLM